MHKVVKIKYINIGVEFVKIRKKKLFWVHTECKKHNSSNIIWILQNTWNF